MVDLTIIEKKNEHLDCMVKGDGTMSLIGVDGYEVTINLYDKSGVFVEMWAKKIKPGSIEVSTPIETVVVAMIGSNLALLKAMGCHIDID